MNVGIITRSNIACLLIVASLIVRVEPSMASSVDGTWIIRDLVLNIYDCEAKVCGRIVWIRDPARRPSQCGMIIVWGLEATSPNEWTGGSILDPDDNKTYRLSAMFETDGTLHARVFRGTPLFGETEILRRIDLHSLDGLC